MNHKGGVKSMCKFFPNDFCQKNDDAKNLKAVDHSIEKIYIIYGIHTNTSESVTDGLTGVQGARDAYAIRI